jgi:hypothetical protein
MLAQMMDGYQGARANPRKHPTNFFYHFVTTLLSVVYSGGGDGSRTNHYVDST